MVHCRQLSPLQVVHARCDHEGRVARHRGYPWYHSTGGLNHNNVNDAEMDRLVAAQRTEQDPEVKRELWIEIEQRILDQVWDIFWPTTAVARTFWHNHLVNFRPHGIASVFSCYGDGKARNVWLDEGAPSAAVWPEVIGAEV